MPPDAAAATGEAAPATPLLAARAVTGLFALFGAMRGTMSEALRQDDEPLAPMHLRVLKHILDEPGASQQTLVRRSGRDKGQIARLIKDVEAHGLLLREADPDDGRSQRLRLTPAGRAACRRFERHEAAIAQRLFGAMTAAEVEAFIDRLATLQGRLRPPDTPDAAPRRR